MTTAQPPARGSAHGATAGALVVLAVVVAVLGLTVPSAQEGWDLGYMAQALAQAIAAAACLVAARTAVGAGRLAWALLAAGQALLATTNLTFGVVDAFTDVPEVSVFDAFWLAYYVPMLAAVAVFYRRRRPEPGWVGVVDALILTGSLTLIVWEVAITPLADGGAGGVEGTTINTLYPTLDLFGMAVMGWLVLRQAGRPRWLTWVAGSFLAAVVADGIYLRGALIDAPSAIGVSAAVYILAAACLVVAAGRRLAADAADLSDQRVLRRPRPWVQVVPFVIVAPLLFIVTDGHRDPVVDTAADLIIAIVIARLSWSVIRLDSVGRENERLLVTDPLTGAHNRRFLSEEIVRLSARARRARAPLAVIMLDLDRFKLVNDTLGHDVGDAFLRRVVANMTTELRAGDVLCRMGGDEFVVLLPGSDEEGALRLTPRLQDAVVATRREVCPEIPVGGSFGAAALEGEEMDAATLLKHADAAMYGAKRAGGARTLPWRQDTAHRLGLGADPLAR